MQFLGNVQEVTFDGKLIVRATFTPKPRDRVLDNRKKMIGYVVRVFGPVDSPYVSVTPTGGSSLMSAVGRQVYVEGVEDHGKAKGRSR